LVIKASSGREIETLVADLASDAAVTRDVAVARLTVIGARAVERLIALATQATAPASARAAAFRSLEGIAATRALEPALRAFADPDPDVAIAALNTARAFLRTPRGVEALDQVTAVAVDRSRPAPVRVAAIHALSELSRETVKPLLTALRDDPDPDVANALATPGRRAPMDPVRLLQDAAGGVLPPDAATLRRALATSSSDLPVSALQQLVERVRLHEGSETTARSGEWMAARAAAHLALAHRGSRIALYDLRETLESARRPVAVEFLAALTAIGDATCLEALAAAYAHASDALPADDWWPRHVADTFRAIVQRERITRRHGVMKRIEKKFPGSIKSIVEGR
jgi:HEAT repeats